MQIDTLQRSWPVIGLAHLILGHGRRDVMPRAALVRRHRQLSLAWVRRLCLGLFGPGLVMLCGMLGAAWADDAPQFTESEVTFFETRIRPVLVTHCYECHSAESSILKGGLRLDDRAGLLKGGDSGAAIVSKKAEQSLLLKALRYEQLEMPPKGKLSATIIKDFENWIAMGAPDPRQALKAGPRPPVDHAAVRAHWSFQPVRDPSPAPVTNSNWPLDPLDQFVLARLEQAGLEPASDADRYTWLRRVSLDLTGLPPSTGEIESFLQDNSPPAYETVVDRLLASHAFGERWARHWMDLTGYADMMGTSNNVFAEHSWRYRDYLIAAWNKDKPFDRFVREQVAGDLLPADSPEERAENIVATGFLMLGDVEIVEPDKAKLEADHIDTQVSKIGMAFLGMTLGCARCHDHKFDPISQPEYYGIAGMLRSSPSTHKIPFGVWSFLNMTELPETPAELTVRQQREALHEARLAALKAERDQFEMEKAAAVAELAQLEPAKVQPPAGTATDASTSVNPASTPPTAGDNAEQLRLKKESLIRRRDELAQKIGRLGPAIQHAEFFRSQVPLAFAMHDGNQPTDMPIYIRGNPYAPAAVVPRGALSVISWDKFPEIPPGQSGRVQLADWLADPRNLLTPRVQVNRIWQKLFGEGLVRSVDYFGTKGDQPSHPELLDHLTTRLMRYGWSQKQFIRALVLSRTYRLSSANNPEALRIDPDNRLLWRMNRQRLDAEAIRDGLLAVSDELIHAIGGPGLVLEEPENCGDLVKVGVNPPNYSHRKPRPLQEFQRSIYLPVMRTNTTSMDRIRAHFDFVNPAQIAGQRSQTVVPTQVLFVLNNDLFRKRAKALAETLLDAEPQPTARLEQLWLRVFNRPITTVERDDATSFLNQLGSDLAQAGPDAGAPPRTTREQEWLVWTELCHSLLASNEFIFRL